MHPRLEELKAYFALKAPNLTYAQFLSDDYQLMLTEQSKKLFELGKPGQSYVGLVNLETGEIHLYPSFNNKDGLERVDKNGSEFTLDNKNYYVVSKDKLGSRTGDLHEKAVSELMLLENAGSRRKMMGFGIWKDGYSVKFVDALPSPQARIPHEILLIKEKNGWRAYRSGVTQYNEINLNNEIVMMLNSEPLNRAAIEAKIRADIIPKYKILNRKSAAAELGEQEIKFVKNRSTSQNTHSCEYSAEYKKFFRKYINAHEIHMQDLERELPAPVFIKIIDAIGEQLDIPSCINVFENENFSDAFFANLPEDIEQHLSLENLWIKNLVILEDNLSRIDPLEQERIFDFISALPLMHPDITTTIIEIFKEHALANEDINAIQKFVHFEFNKIKNNPGGKASPGDITKLLMLLVELKKDNPEKSFADITFELDKLNHRQLPALHPEGEIMLTLYFSGLHNLAKSAVELSSHESAQMAIEQVQIELEQDDVDAFTRFVKKSNPDSKINKQESDVQNNIHLQQPLETLVHTLQAMSDSLDNPEKNKIEKMTLDIVNVWNDQSIPDLKDKLNIIVDVLKSNYEVLCSAYPKKLMMNQQPMHLSDALNKDQNKNHHARFLALALQSVYNNEALCEKLEDRNKMTANHLSMLLQIKQPADHRYAIFNKQQGHPPAPGT